MGGRRGELVVLWVPGRFECDSSVTGFGAFVLNLWANWETKGTILD